MEEEELVMLILQVTGVLTAGLRGALQKQSIFTKICSHYKKSFCFFKGFFSPSAQKCPAHYLSLENEVIKIERHGRFQFWNSLLKQRTKSEVKPKQEHGVFSI